MLDKVNEEKVEKIITVGFSNNGAAVYQHLSQQVLQGQGPEVIGSVFDSGPSPPWGFTSSLVGVRKSGTGAYPPYKLSMIAYMGVNLVNNLSISDTIKLSFQQIQASFETYL